MRLSWISLVVPLVCGIALSVLAADRAFTSYESVKAGSEDGRLGPPSKTGTYSRSGSERRSDPYAALC